MYDDVISNFFPFFGISLFSPSRRRIMDGRFFRIKKFLVYFPLSAFGLSFRQCPFVYFRHNLFGTLSGHSFTRMSGRQISKWRGDKGRTETMKRKGGAWIRVETNLQEKNTTTFLTWLARRIL